MRNIGLHLYSSLLVVLSLATPVCLLVLVGLYVYSGSFLPSTVGMSGIEALSIWVGWGLLVAIPPLTILLLLPSLRSYPPKQG